MATDSVRTGTQHRSAQAQPFSLGEMAQALVMPLASLKLTVSLLILAVVVTFIATLDQTRADVYDVKMKHFENLFVAVPFQTFFVPAWAPNYQNVPGRFFIPSGLTVLVLLLVNLTAAHLMRFRLQARGTRLIVGLIVAAFAALTTWAVIFNGQNADGFQVDPPIEYRTMWSLMLGGLALLGVASVVGAVRVGTGRRIEFTLMALSGLVCLGLLGVALSLEDAAFLGDSAMRILWQLIQATMAALVAYAACAVLFRRKAGMVLLHLGVAGLMFNEIFVTVTNNEQRMTIFEGDTISQAIDVRATEMAILDLSGESTDTIISIPGRRLARQEKISDPQLPFDVECVEYLPSSDLRAVSGERENPATAGIGLIGEAFAVPPVTGTDSEQTVDFASAYVRLTDKESEEDLGTYLISQQLADAKADTVTVGGVDYRILLRFKTEYKPYSLTLTDAVRENYLGTDIAKYYGSQVVIKDLDSDFESNQTIFMNNPLRYSDETFYQSGMDRLPGGREYSVLQIVTNVGWMIPYVCCMFSVVGLVAQFGASLLAFLEKSRQRSTAPPVADLADAPAKRRNGSWLGWAPAGVVVGLAVVASLYQFSKVDAPVAVEGMRLDLLAQVPVTFEGRVQPLGSFARNTARQLRERESVQDGNNQTQAAITWLADVVFERENFGDYRTFRITDPTIINALDLPKAFRDPNRTKFIYTIDEVLATREKLNELIPDPREKDPKTWTRLQSRLATLRGKIQRLVGMKLLFGSPVDADDPWLVRIETDRAALTSDLTPLLVPGDNDQQPWMAMTLANSQQWLSELGAKLEQTSVQDLARTIIEDQVVPPLREDTIRQRIIQRFLSDPQFMEVLGQQNVGDKDPQELARVMLQNWDSLPERIRVDLFQAEAPLVDAMLQQQMPQFVSRLEAEILPLNGDRQELSAGGPAEHVEKLQQIQQAYVDGDAETFNQTLTAYLAAVDASPPQGYSAGDLRLERCYNQWMPFFLATLFYMAGFLLAAVSWLGFRVPVGRAAMGLLILAVLLHAVGIIMRIAISDRPPVTNLYSSVLFVGAVGAAMLILMEAGTRLGLGSALAGIAGFASLTWAASMTIVDGDTFTVMVAVLDTSFWLATHVVCISIGYAATFVAGLMGIAYLVVSLISPMLREARDRRLMYNVIYGCTCFGLLASFFGTVLGGLWGDDSWGRFWGWDPKENGALMIVLWNAVLLHARWGGMVKERGFASLATLGNIIVLWSWKGVNAMGVGLHAYAGTEDKTLQTIILVGLAHLVVAALVLIPGRYWISYRQAGSPDLG